MMGIEDKSFFSSEDEYEEARAKIIELTGADISQAVISSGTRNVTYVLSNSVRPSVIRISLASVKPLAAVQSELMFVDYLREHIRTVCNPVPFDNRLVNTISIGGEDYYVVVSRKANGVSPSPAEFASEHLFELYGAKIGQLHAASETAAKEGFRYQRPNWTEAPGFCFGREGTGADVPRDVLEVMLRIRDRVAELPQTSETFGMIHGDMTPLNTFLDWDDVWLFDFDDCCYHYFIYDICAFLYQARRFATEAGAGFDPVEVMRRGYERHNHLPEECWSADYMGRLSSLRMASATWLIGQARTAAGIELAQRHLPHMYQMLRGMGAELR